MTFNPATPRKKFPRGSRGMTLEQRFWEKVDKSPGQGPKGDCWVWIASVRKVEGYGQIGTLVNGKWQMMYSHRLSYELNIGPIPEGLDVCHTCDYPPCVRPTHLFAATPQGNIRDAQRKGRFPVKKVEVKERAWRVTLTPEQALTIKLRRIESGIRQCAIAALAEIDYTHYCRVEQGTSNRSIHLEKLHFLLRYLGIGESEFNLSESQLRQFGEPLRVQVEACQ